MDIVKSVLDNIIERAICAAEAGEAALSLSPGPGTSTTSISAAAMPAAKSPFDTLPVLKALAAKRGHARTIILAETPHSHYRYAKPALVLVPDKLACVEWVEIKNRAGKRISAFMTDVQIVSGPNAQTGHSFLVTDVFVNHYTSGHALRVELMLYDASNDHCFHEYVTNVGDIIDRTTPPKLSSKAADIIEKEELKFECDNSDPTEFKQTAHQRSPKYNTAMPADDGPIASRLLPRSHSATPPEQWPAEDGDGDKQKSKARTRGAHGGVSKVQVKHMVDAAADKIEKKLSGQMKRYHDEMLGQLAAIGTAEHDSAAKRTKITSASQPALAQSASPTLAAQLACAASAPPTRVSLGQLQTSREAAMQLLAEDSEMALTDARIAHELLQDEVRQQGQGKRAINVARLVSAMSYQEGVAEGERRAAAYFQKGQLL